MRNGAGANRFNDWLRALYVDLTIDVVCPSPTVARQVYARTILWQSKSTIANFVAATVATTLVLLYRTVFTASVVAFTFKIIRVAGGTERRVLGFPGGPPLHTIRTAADRRTVAAITPRIPAVIAQFIFNKGTVRVMTEIGRRPAIGGMTHIALVGCVQVTVWFFSCATAVVMTILAVVGGAGIVHPAATSEGRSGMTGDTIQVGWKMVRHGVPLASRRITIVAGNAVVGDAAMIESRRFEDARVMADTAIPVSIDMVDFLGCGKTGIVTRSTIIDDARVTKGRRLETGSLMAVPAITVGRHMKIRFPGGGSAIVTRLAAIIVPDKLVIEPGTGKSRSVMAHRAVLGCRNVAVVHTYCRTISIGKMTGCTVIHDAGMIEYGRLEVAARDVADTAIIRGRNVVGFVNFSSRWRLKTVMAGIAARGQHGRGIVVDRRVRKISRIMARHAIGRSDRVRALWVVIRGRCHGPGANGSN